MDAVPDSRMSKAYKKSSEAIARWNHSANGQAARARYRASEKGKATEAKRSKKHHPHKLGYCGDRTRIGIYDRLLRLEEELVQE
jgi:hypothetical protein